MSQANLDARIEAGEKCLKANRANSTQETGAIEDAMQLPGAASGCHRPLGDRKYTRPSYTDDQLMAGGAALLYRRAMSAVYAAYGRLERSFDDRVEDARQAAAIAYWQTHQKHTNDAYAWTTAKYVALQELLDTIPNYLSLDYQDDDHREPWGSNLPAGEPDLDDPWLDHVDLEVLVRELFATDNGRWKARLDETVRAYAALLRLLARGYDTAAIAIALDTSERTVNNMRAKLRRKLFAYCEKHGIDTSHITVEAGGWRPAHHYAHRGTAAGKGREAAA